jgi:hypothetical protein
MVSRLILDRVRRRAKTYDLLVASRVVRNAVDAPAAAARAAVDVGAVGAHEAAVPAFAFHGGGKRVAAVGLRQDGR